MALVEWLPICLTLTTVSNNGHQHGTRFAASQETQTQLTMRFEWQIRYSPLISPNDHLARLLSTYST
ncbi:hypothetical protein T06_2127 [Trichinella sp. T6]|nr:hypothetical protein T06_2127 [Trichinella sp. T6]